MQVDNPCNYNRRQVLQATAGIGALGGLVSGTTLAASAKTEKIVTHKRGDEPLITKEVSRQWKAQLENARKAKARIEDQYMADGAVQTIALTGIDERIGERQKFGVKVELDPEKPAPAFPDSPEGVSLQTTEYEERKPMACHGNSDYDSLPGGVILNGASSGSPYFYDYDNDGGLESMHLTAGHIFGDNCNDLENNSVSQKADTWGSVEIHDPTNDYALCTPNCPLVHHRFSRPPAAGPHPS